MRERRKTLAGEFLRNKRGSILPRTWENLGLRELPQSAASCGKLPPESAISFASNCTQLKSIESRPAVPAGGLPAEIENPRSRNHLGAGFLRFGNPFYKAGPVWSCKNQDFRRTGPGGWAPDPPAPRVVRVSPCFEFQVFSGSHTRPAAPGAALAHMPGTAP